MLLLFSFGIVFLILLVAGFLFPFADARKNQKSRQEETIAWHHEGNQYTLFTARTPRQHMKGLSGIYEKPKEVDGMIFLFKKPKRAAFWNYNTHLDLTLLWLSNGTIIGETFLPKIETGGLKTVHSPKEVDAVVELIL